MNEKDYKELKEFWFEDGYRFMTQEDYDRLYTLNDLKNTLLGCGSFLWQNRGMVFSTVSFFSGFVSFSKNVNASVRTPIDTEAIVIDQPFDANQSYQEFLERTGNLKIGKTKSFGKSHRIGSALENQPFSQLNQPLTKNFLTLANFVSYAKNEGVQGVRPTLPVLNNVQNVFQGKK